MGLAVLSNQWEMESVAWNSAKLEHWPCFQARYAKTTNKYSHYFVSVTDFSFTQLNYGKIVLYLQGYFYLHKKIWNCFTKRYVNASFKVFGTVASIIKWYRAIPPGQSDVIFHNKGIVLNNIFIRLSLLYYNLQFPIWLEITCHCWFYSSSKVVVLAS